jgi:hypothetical protein
MRDMCRGVIVRRSSTYQLVFCVFAAIGAWATLGVFSTAAASTDYPFGWSAQRQPGAAVTYQFQYQTESACGNSTTQPDGPARAFRYQNASGLYHVQLNFAQNTQNRRMVGMDLHSAKRESSYPSTDPDYRACSDGSDVVFKAAKLLSDPATYANWEWLYSPYYDAQSGKVYALVHNEFHGADTGQCANGSGLTNCWFGSITSVSSDPGNDLLQRPDPNHGNTCVPSSPPSPNPNKLGSCYAHSTYPASAQDLVASIPYQYCSGSAPPNAVTNFGRAGYSQVSNILKGEGDQSGFYYALIAVSIPNQPPGGCAGTITQKAGVCLLRTSDISAPSSWMAWDGSGFNSRPSGAYSTPTGGLCAPVSTSGLNPWSLTYNTYLNKYMWLGQSPSRDGHPTGIYYSLSDDLMNWSDPQFLMRAPTNVASPPDTSDCAYDPVSYPTLLDPSDTASTWTVGSGTNANFDHPGRTPDIYFTHWTRTSCPSTSLAPGADLARIPIQFNQRVATLSDALTDDPGNPKDRGFDSTAHAGLNSQVIWVGCSPSCRTDYDTDSVEKSFWTYLQGQPPQQSYGYGQIGQANDGTGGMPIGWTNSDEAWYGAAFFLPSGVTANSRPAPIDLMRWEDSQGSFSGIRVQADGQLQLVANNAPLDVKEFPAPEGRWFWLEVHQKLGATNGAALNEVFLDGRLVSTSSIANYLGVGPVMRVKYGLVNAPLLSGQTANLFVDRASVTGGPLGALIYTSASQNPTANAVGVPKTPTGLMVSGSSGGSSTLTWNVPGPGDPPVNGYRLYQQQVDGTWMQIGGDITSGNSATAPCGKSYRIAAFRTLGDGTTGESLYSSPLVVPSC